MSLRIVGAGLGRTGTNSLKLALERLLGGPCYHMIELFRHPDHVSLWHDAALDKPVDWDRLFDGYVAAVDWPVAGVWEQIADAYDAPVLLSTRSDADAWWRSASDTIFVGIEMERTANPTWFAMMQDIFARDGIDISDEGGAKAAYERHNAYVRATVPPSRLIDWRPGDGWAPLCEALDVPVPDEPFPHVNTTEEFRARFT